MSDNRDYIQNKFDNDGIKAPESLSEDSILKMLEEADAPKTDAPKAPKKEFTEAKPAKRPRMRPENRRVLAIAASFMIAIFGLAAIAPVLDQPPDTSVVNGELYIFRSASEIKRTVKKLDASESGGLFRKYSDDTDMIVEEYDAAEDVNGLTAGDSATGSAEVKNFTTEPHSETYLQVEDVDEADIVKTDGRYIYYVNKDKEVVILEAKDGETRKVSTIGNSNVENYVDDIYLNGDKLITVGYIYSLDSDDPGSSGVVIYDISDRSKPVTVADFRQTGSVVSSRMVGDFLYLVTEDYVSGNGRLVPLCGIAENMKELRPSDISCVPEPQTASYIVLSAIDTSAAKDGKASTKAILGATEDIYCNDHALYSASSEWDGKSNTEYTRIAKASLDGLDVKFDATAKVRGRIVNQFSMDETDGYFRIATTSQRNGMDVNNLFVLDNGLNEVGSVTGFARNESIKSVRFMGSKAYVITYEAIDPLFIIDLADPENPRIEGEVKIDGFSTLLIPVSEGRLLGIGHATGDNGYGGDFDTGLKLAHFDISDPSAPKVLDSKEFENMSSPAQSNHLALTINREAGWMAIPYDIYNYGNVENGGDVVVIEDAEVSDDARDVEDAELIEDDVTVPKDYHETGVLVFGADDSIRVMDQHAIDADSVLRNVYIGDYIYALDKEGCAGSFRPSV